MTEIRFKKTCNINGKKYKVGKKFNPTVNDILLINKLNETGFIEPLTRHEMSEIYKKLIENRKEDK